MKLPCGCVYTEENEECTGPIFWNPYNEAVCCHMCGARYDLRPAINPWWARFPPLRIIRAEFADLIKARRDLEESVKQANEARTTACKNVWDFMQFVVGTWGQRTFNNIRIGNLRGITRHMREEVYEIEEAANEGDLEGVADECADVNLMLSHIAHVYNFSLYEATKKKFGVCQERTWAPPDSDGIVRHIREPEKTGRQPEGEE